MSNKNNDDLKYQASENTLGLNPVVGLRGKDLLASARMVLKQAIEPPSPPDHEPSTDPPSRNLSLFSERLCPLLHRSPSGRFR